MSTSINDFGPAFPLISEDHRAIRHLGMSLRDYFAAAALQGMLSDPNNCTALQENAMYAYRFADAMLAEREKGARS